MKSKGYLVHRNVLVYIILHFLPLQKSQNKNIQPAFDLINVQFKYLEDKLFYK